MKTIKNKNIFMILSILTFIFLCRVLAQLMQYFYPIDSLPAFEFWYSGTISYPWLFFIQVMILVLQARILIAINKGIYTFNQKRGKMIYVFGVSYFSFSVLRLILGSSILNNHQFWGAMIPSIFHVFLSAFFLVLGFYNLNNLKIREEVQ